MDPPAAPERQLKSRRRPLPPFRPPDPTAGAAADGTGDSLRPAERMRSAGISSIAASAANAATTYAARQLDGQGRRWVRLGLKRGRHRNRGLLDGKSQAVTLGIDPERRRGVSSRLPKAVADSCEQHRTAEEPD